MTIPDLPGSDVEDALSAMREGRNKEVVKSFLRLVMQVPKLRAQLPPPLPYVRERAGIDPTVFPALEIIGYDDDQGRHE